MPLFRNIRNSLSRGRSSSRDTTPVRLTRPASFTGNAPVQRRDSSVDSRTDSFFSRSDTFILDSQSPDDQRSQNSSNTSTLENKSKKSKMFSKFSTFSKRKKPIQTPKELSLDHHPSEHATNTYYKWQSEGPSTLDYDAKLDPFNFLYEQPSSLMEIQNKGINTEPVRTNSIGTHYDSITVRRSKHSRDAALNALQLKEQLAAESSPPSKSRTAPEPEPEQPLVESEPEEEKFKTVTINSFRKSFRDRLLKQKNDVPHNPAWFVEVEKPEEEQRLSRSAAKVNSNEVLIFANENYRPLIRSPVRDHKSNSLRSSMGSPVKRNETFRIDRHFYEQTVPTPSPSPSIRIEIKNSITPNVPGRMVPVGVAKPMPSISSLTSPNASNYKLRMPASPSPVARKNYAASTKRPNDLEPGDWFQPTAAHVTNASTTPKIPAREGRYQTLVQIRTDSKNAAPPVQCLSAPSMLNSSSQPLRIQLSSSGSNDNNRASQTSLQYRNLSTKSTQHTSSQAPRFESSSTTSLNYIKPVSKTYFGDSQRLQQNVVAVATATGFKPHSSKSGGRSAPVESANKSKTRSYFIDSNRPSSQHQFSMSTTTVPMVQRRSRSPIKLPWR